MTAQAETRGDPFAPFVPALLRERVARGVPDERVEEHASAAMLADISGFTRLTEQLARRGPEGVELLSEAVNRELEALAETVEAYGGDVVKFAGDAIVALWITRGEPMIDAVRRATRCALAIQRMQHTSALDGGEPLRVRIGVGAGVAALMTLGAAGRREFFVGGDALTQMGVAERGVEPGDVGLSPEAWAVLAAEAEGEPLASGVVRVRRVVEREAERARPLAAAPTASDAIRPFIPELVIARLEAGQAGWLSELRTISVVFLNVRPADARLLIHRASLQDIVERFQDWVARFGGEVNKILLEDKGLLLLAAFGLPRASHADDAARAVFAAREIADAMNERGHEFGVGVTTGPALCGIFGGRRRREYSVLGAVVNRAARLMLLTERDVLCDEATARATATQVIYESLPPVVLKGMTRASAVFRPADARRRGSRGASPGAECFVGRALEREALERALSKLVNGTGGAIYVDGERGIGKSALLQQFTATLRARGVLVLASGGEMSTVSDAYGAWRPALASLLELPLDAEPEVYGNAILGALAEHSYGFSWAPLLNALTPATLPETSTTRAMAGAAKAEATIELVVHLLQRAPARPGCALVLDDAHWIDRTSWTLIDAVRRRCPGLLIIVASQPVKALEGAPEQHRLRDELATVIELGPLLRADVDELARGLLELDPLPRELAELLWRKSEGHPFLCVELARELAATVTRDDGSPRVSSTALARVELPETAMGIALSRIDHEPTRHQLTLKVASVVGRSFAFALVHDVHPVEADRATLPAQCLELIQREFLHVVHELPRLQYAFTSGLMRDAAYSVLAFAQRRQLHHDVARWYERDDTALRASQAELAYHWRRAEELGKALRCLDVAATRAMDSGAYADAASSLRELLELADDRRAPSFDALQRARWRRMLGYAASALGEHDEAITSLRGGLAELGYSLPRTRLGWALRILAAFFHILVTARLSALVRGRGSAERRARMTEIGALATGFQAEYFHATELTKSLGCSVIAVSHAERAGAVGPAADAYNNMGYLVGLLGRARLADRYFERAGRGDARAAINSYFARALLVLGQGKIRRSEQLVRDGLTMSEEFGDRHMNAVGESILCSALELPGRFRQALEHALRLLQMAKTSSSRRFALWGQVERSFVLSMLGELDEAVAASPPEDDVLAQEDALTRIGFFGLRGAILLRAGRAASAEEAVRRALDMIRKTGPDVFPHIKALTAMCEVFLARWAQAADAGDDVSELRARAQESVKMLRSNARLFPIGRSRAERLRGALLRQEGASGGGRRCFERALRLARAGELVADEGLARLELARCPGLPASERSDHAEAAAALFSSLEMNHERALARRLVDVQA